MNAYFNAWRDEGIFSRINADLTGLARIKAGRATEPTAAVIDTQSVKTSVSVPAAEQGTDAAKKIVDRKRGIVIDTLRLLLAVIIVAPSVSETSVGISLPSLASAVHPGIFHMWANEGFKKQVVEHGAGLGIDVENIPRKAGVKGFAW